MRRIVCPERDDWRQTAEQCGFAFHTIDGERYWDERAYYAFTLDEIERGIETPTGEIDAMCLELAGRVIGDERYLRRLKIPEAFWSLIAESWQRDDRSLYGRLDLRFDGTVACKTARIQRGYADLDFRGCGVSMDLARTGDRTPHHPDARRPVQLHPRTADRGVEGDCRRPPCPSHRHHRQRGGCRHARLSRGHRAPGGARRPGCSTSRRSAGATSRRLRRSRRRRHRARLQALSLGMDVPRRLRRQAR